MEEVKIFENGEVKDISNATWTNQVAKYFIYLSFEVKQNLDNALVIQLSENVIINLSEKKVNFMPKSEVEQIVKDIQFLEAFQQGTSLYIDKNKMKNIYREPSVSRMRRLALRRFQSFRIRIS